MCRRKRRGVGEGVGGAERALGRVGGGYFVVENGIGDVLDHLG